MMSRWSLVGSMATEMVCARSCAEMPVVTPSRASIDTVKAVEWRERLDVDISSRWSCLAIPAGYTGKPYCCDTVQGAITSRFPDRFYAYFSTRAGREWDSITLEIPIRADQCE